ncbi:glutamine amidotransferase, partial [Rhizobium leguminosarum]
RLPSGQRRACRRRAAWTSDIGPHWLSPAFCEWEG